MTHTVSLTQSNPKDLETHSLSLSVSTREPGRFFEIFSLLSKQKIWFGVVAFGKPKSIRSELNLFRERMGRLRLVLLLLLVSHVGARHNDLTSRLVKQVDDIADVLGEKIRE